MESLEAVIKRIEDLVRDLSAKKVVQEAKTHLETFTRSGYMGNDPIGIKDGKYIEEKDNMKIIDQSEIIGPDIQKRESARKELNSIVQNPNELQITRYVAARALGIKADSKLGYCPVRLWAHYHRVAATLTSIVIIGAASGLVYTLVKYFSK